MKNLFFYGTLRHVPLLEVVLGRTAADIDVTPAALPGYRVSSVAEGPFPTIGEDPDAVAEGVCVAGLSDQDIARLDFYEGSFAYDLRPVTLIDGRPAEVYYPQPGLWTPGGEWHLQDWEADFAALSVTAAREVMGYFGNRSAEDVAAMFPMIRARAASQLRGAQSLHGRDTLAGKVDILARERAYAKFFAVDDFSLRHERFDGTMSEVLDRAVFVTADAALVMPYDPVRDRVLLVEQVRMAPIARGDRACWQLEPIAGRVDAGETPEEAAHREAREEAEITLNGLEKIAEVYPSPGTSTEFFYIYLGLAGLPDGTAGVSGLISEHENIRSHLLSFDDLMARVDSFDVANAPLALSAYYLARHRDRLRSDGARGTPEGE